VDTLNVKNPGGKMASHYRTKKILKADTILPTIEYAGWKPKLVVLFPHFGGASIPFPPC